MWSGSKHKHQILMTLHVSKHVAIMFLFHDNELQVACCLGMGTLPNNYGIIEYVTGNICQIWLYYIQLHLCFSLQPFSVHLKDDFSAAEGKISRNEEDHYKTLTEPPKEADPCARVYRTFHACDLPLKLKSTQPLTPQPRTRQPFLNGKQLRKRHSDMYIVNSCPASKRIPKYKKRLKNKLKLHIPEQTAEFSKVDTEKPRFEVQIIEEGKPTRSDSPVYDPQYTPTEESNPLIK